MVLGFRVSYYNGAEYSTGSSRAPMCPCSACWEGLPHGTKAMNSWRKTKQPKATSDSPSSSTSSLASTVSEKSSKTKKDSSKKRTLVSRLTRRPSTESFASDMVPLRGATTRQSTAETLVSCGERDSFLEEKI